MASYLDRLVKYYGVTDNPYLGAFLLPDGDFLDFSEGSGSRIQDHRNITWVLPRDWEGPRDSRYDGMVRVCKRVGMYRWMPESWLLECWTPPTPDQRAVIEGLAMTKSLTVEAYKGKGRRREHHYDRYDRWDDPRDAARDLRRFFGGGW